MTAAFFSFMLNAAFNYLFEGIYYFIRKHINKDKRKTYVYAIIFGIAIGAMCLMAVYCNGMISSREHPAFITSYFITLIIDILIIDTILLIYAFISLDTPLLGFLAFRGFYIRLDEENLYKKVDDKSMVKDG